LAEKAEIRKQIKAAREALSPDAVKQKSRRIKQRLQALKKFREAECLMLYCAFNNEVDTIEIITEALEQRKKILLPQTDIAEHEIVPRWVSNLDDDLRPGSYGIMEPADHTASLQNTEQIDLCVVPGIAFDRHGNRIGRGAGFYDNFLARINPRTLKVALAFDLQVVLDSIPHSKHDIAMDMIITEQEVIHPARC